jgi:FKBP-type peptidyl-prolyl cis-trans isomerase SlyD
MKIAAGTLVRLDIAMYDAQGQLLEASVTPLVYLHGAQDIFARIEQALEGQQAGFAVSLRLEPREAFGDDDPSLVHLVPLAQLGEGAAVGLRYAGLPGAPDDGRLYTVTDIAAGMAVVDGNHPLAGRALRFDLKVVGVEAADPADLAAAVVPDFLRVPALPAGPGGSSGSLH